MRKNGPLFFIFILILTIFCLVINLSEPFTIKINSPLPFINKAFSVNQRVGFNLQPLLTRLNIHRNFAFHRGLDLEGGTSITLQADMKGIPEAERDNALQSAQTVIEKRINLYGVSEPIVQTSKANKDYRVIVEIPGITDVNQAVQLVGKTAKLTFWEQSSPSAKEDSAKTATDSAAIEGAIKAGVPVGVLQLFGATAQKTNLNGNDLKQASVTFDPNSGKPEVQLSFSPDGAKKFGEITKRNVGKVVAIALDNQVVEAPRVNEPIFGGQAVITGDFTTEQAKNVQIQLNAGALPVSLSVLEQRAVGATLGELSLQKSLIAGFFGFAVIVIFMIVLYGRLGFIASMALVIYTLMVLALFRLIPVTLTLAGIAGLVLSIGIAVDANILIFERMKEELRKGRSHDMAVELGFSRAWPAIRDSNVSSLITSVVLFYFGTGIVRGFAFTLALGILVSMFSAIFVTRTFLQIFYRGNDKVKRQK
jgi:preprotein translocase subunit SecD